MGIEAAIERAKEQEKKCEWLEAAESYEQALHSESIPVRFAAETRERIGFCFRRASTQTEDLEEFRKIRQCAVEAYRNAAKLFEKEEGLRNQGKSAQCYAIAEYLRSWLAPDPSEKRKMLDDCRSFGRKSLEAYRNAGDELNYGKACNDLLSCLLERLYVASDWREMKDIVQEGIDCGDKSIAVLSKLGDKSELLRAYSTASLQSWNAYLGEQEEKKDELMRRSLGYSEKALELSREVDDLYYTAMSHWAAAFCTLLFTEKTESALEHAKEMLKQGTILRDNYLKGVASYVLAFATDWMIPGEEDPDKKKEGQEKVIKYSEDAIRYLQPISQDFFIAQTYLFYAETYSSLARDVVTSLAEKRATLEKAVDIGRKGLEHATRSGSPDAMVSALHALSKALHFCSHLETEKQQKIRLLEEALTRREEYIKVVERSFPFYDWIRGVGKNYEGLTHVELAKVETDKVRKIALLESAVSDMEDGVSHCRKWVFSRPVQSPVQSQIATVAGFEDTFGSILNELYLLTEDKEILTRAIDAYEDAAKMFQKVNLSSRAAESCWKMATKQDRLGKHVNAAESFENASKEYEAAAQRIQHFADFYLDHATYMKAWSEIERAKLADIHEEYSDAMKHYENTANFLKQSKLWSYLSSNFLAWGLLEHAEDLSRKERSLEAIEAFEKAADLFKEAREAFEEEIGKIKVQDEKKKAMELSNACLGRKSYCLARANLEQAKAYDRNGDYTQSAEKYDSATAMFNEILSLSQTETERKEIEPILHMCQAWQKMEMADARDSPELYHEASELFMKAREFSTKDKISLMASGNAAFCRALEYGTMFEATRDVENFTKAKQFFESAASYYLKAGFEHASLWTTATEILFDAYNYMNNAETEVDPQRKMKGYLLAERCLEKSAGLYEKAGYVGKRDEVQKTLKKVKEKREFTLSLDEIMTAPSDAASTSIISAPSSTVEEPVGFSKFEGAFVQANLVAYQKEVKFGEDFRLEIHLANLGKDPAYLNKVEEIISEGFQLIEKPAKCIVEDGSLNLKGRKLAALETDDITLAFKPKKKGKFVLKPKIQYMNEAGEHKSCELEQVAVSVREMGIREWLRGPS